MAVKINKVPVITDDRTVVNISSFAGDLLLDGAQRICRVMLTDWIIDCSKSNYFTATVESTGVYTFGGFPTDRSYGFVLEMQYKSGVVGWPSYVHWPNNVAPKLEPNRTSLFVFIKSKDATEWLGTAIANYDTRIPIDDNPDVFDFIDVTGAALSSWFESNVTTVTGLQPNALIPVSIDTGQIDADAITLLGVYSTDRVVSTTDSGALIVRARVKSSDVGETPVVAVIHVGVGSANWSITTRVVDLTPDHDSFKFIDVTGAELGSTTLSNLVMVTGLEPGMLVTVRATGGQLDAGEVGLSGTFSSSKIITTSATGTIQIQVRASASTSELTSTVVGVTLGTTSTSWTVTTKAIDKTPDPDPFRFIDVTGAGFNRPVLSNVVTVTGLEPSVNIIVTATGGQIDVGATGTFQTTFSAATSPTGTLRIQARLTTGAQELEMSTMTITIDDTPAVWHVTTKALITTPNATSFKFIDQTDVEFSTQLKSNSATVTGLEPNYTYTVTTTGGEMDAGSTALSGAFTTTQTIMTDVNGSFVIQCRTTSSASESTSTAVLVTIGTVSTTWSVKTRRLKLTPTVLFVDRTGVETTTAYLSNTPTVTGLEPNYTFIVTAIDGDIDAGTIALGGTFGVTKTIVTDSNGTFIIQAKTTSSPDDTTPVTVKVTIGSATVPWTVITRAGDVTPDPVKFIDVVNAVPGVYVTSNIVTVTGLEPGRWFTIAAKNGGEVDAGTTAVSGTFGGSIRVFTSPTGTLVVQARMKSSTLESMKVTMDVTIGTETVQWNVTTADVTPDLTTFKFVDVVGAELSAVVTSQVATITGLAPNYAFDLKALRGEIDAGPTLAMSGVYAPLVKATSSADGKLYAGLRATSSEIDKTKTTVDVSLGANNATWQITTVDLTPDASSFAFPNVVKANMSTAYTSLTITVTGLEPNRKFGVWCTGGEIDCGTTAVSGTFGGFKLVTTSAVGSFVCILRSTSSASPSTSTATTVSIGGAIKTVDIVAGSMTLNGMKPSTDYYIGAVGGLVVDGPISVTQIVIRSSATGTINLVASGVGTVTAAVMRGSTTQTVTTREYDLVPDPFAFIDQIDVNPGTVIESNVITVTGLEPNHLIIISVSGGNVDLSSTGTLPGTFTGTSVITSATGTFVMQAQVTSSSTLSATTDMTVTIGGISTKWAVKTANTVKM